MVMILARAGVAIVALILAEPTRAASFTPDQMCQIIRQDIADYLSTHHPCPCPYSIMRNGRACGDWSAWAKPNGRAPRCYFEDVDGTFQPNRAPNPTRERWPDPPPCDVTS